MPSHCYISKRQTSMLFAKIRKVQSGRFLVECDEVTTPCTDYLSFYSVKKGGKRRGAQKTRLLRCNTS
jgi:hypothetical protein